MTSAEIAMDYAVFSRVADLLEIGLFVVGFLIFVKIVRGKR